jgi:hypothetical protein
MLLKNIFITGITHGDHDMFIVQATSKEWSKTIHHKHNRYCQPTKLASKKVELPEASLYHQKITILLTNQNTSGHILNILFYL